jgi:hypothetical protein
MNGPLSRTSPRRATRRFSAGVGRVTALAGMVALALIATTTAANAATTATWVKPGRKGKQ